ncbi:Abi family protein [uncultured Senegalimassilia sp.]|uniref:Abi family protein n=1 Tax=uncultured Senegalimassilia sp. TaxID=1714350 RepID=UPI0026730093|nr:Abi family protein [uncultured Senegalimassilia sp.]
MSEHGYVLPFSPSASASGVVELHSHRKPMLTVEQQIAHLKSKGVMFERCSEEDAARYLSSSNNYLRAASYRVLFPRQVDGPNVGAYVGLDFAHLVELSRIDRRLRAVLREITADIEHFAKVKVLRFCEDCGEDGYRIVADFLASISHAERNRLLGGLRARARLDSKRDTYLGDLIDHYIDEMPVWVLLEASEFGVLANFWLFCSQRWEDSRMMQEHYVLKSVKALRNAVSHGSCIVNGFGSSGELAGYRPNELITDSLNTAGMRNTKTRRARLRNLRMSQIAATLYMSAALCPNRGTRTRHAIFMNDVRVYAESQSHLFSSNDNVKYSFDFIWKLVDVWVPMR